MGRHELEKAAELVVASLTTTVVEASWLIEDPVLVSKVKVDGVGGVAVTEWLDELVVVAAVVKASLQARSHQFVSGPVDRSIYACCVRRNAREARPLGGCGGMPPQKNFAF